MGELVYSRNPNDTKVNMSAAQVIAKKLSGRYGADSVHYYTYRERQPEFNFPVQLHDGRCVACNELSTLLQNPPILEVNFVFIAPEQVNAASAWLIDLGSMIAFPTITYKRTAPHGMDNRPTEQAAEFLEEHADLVRRVEPAARLVAGHVGN